MIQSDKATAIAISVHAEAYRRKAPNGTLEEQVRTMVKRWRRDGYKGTAAQWNAIARMVERP